MEAVLLLLIVVLLTIDQYALTQFLHRPIIACTLFGAVLGDITTGAIVGGTLELLVLAFKPMQFFYNEASTILMSMVGVYFAIHEGLDVSEATVIALLVFGVETTLRHLLSFINILFLRGARHTSEKKNPKGIQMRVVAPLVLTIIIYVVCGYLLIQNAGILSDTISTFLHQYGYI